MVGIAGGAPRKHDIRLGDIVVGCAGNGKGGVFGYDFGKAIQGQGFQETGFLNQPLTLLRTTSGTDHLFKSEVTYDLSCGAICSEDTLNFVSRAERTEDEDDPAIHYGLIASADRLMKDALARDRLSEEKGVLCFKMEAAGLMNHFPCLVIRGICDYSESHKNKEWQGYAAMVAAAYAKDLLREIAPNRVEAERKISDILSDFQEIAQEHRDVSKEHRDIAKEQLQAQKDLAKERLFEEQQRCHQLFRLTTNNNDATYEWYKGRVEERVEGTCMWFLKHDHFQTWLNQESGPLLVSADPGCGKSVLAKYLIDHGLPRSTTICYFFFKNQDQNTVRQALCALLHQLFSLQPSLIEHAMLQFHEDGRGLVKSTESLWKILRNSVRDPQAGSVIVILDALDECAESEFADLMRNVENQFRNDQLGYGKLKYLLTCRPYNQILSKVRVLLDAFPKIHIPGEEESETITQEVNHVIRHRINQLAIEKRLTTQIKNHLEKRLQEATHRTYLWVYLVFDYLQKHDFKKTLKGIKSAVATLPTSVNEAYEQILDKANKDPMVPKVLSIILAASRPLTLSEMNVAVNIDDICQSIDDLDLEDDEDFKARLRSWCGLFVSIHQGSIYFIHQTAREFLLADLASPKAVSPELHWHHSITTYHAHAILAKICVLYLNFFNSNVGLLTDMDGEADHCVDGYPFLDYTAESWGTHFRKAGFIEDDSIIPLALRMCDTGTTSYSTWFGIYWRTLGRSTIEWFTDLMIASYYGHHVIVKLLLDDGAEIDAGDSESGRTPLLWAAENGHEAIIKLLLDRGAKIEAENWNNGQTPLLCAAKNGHEASAKLLLDKGAKIEAKDRDSLTPLLRAANNGHEAIAKLILDKGAEIEAKDRRCGQIPLLLAAENGYEAIVKLLLDKGAEIEAKDRQFGQTPLSLAAENGHEAIVKLLLVKGDARIEDTVGRIPLLFAAKNGYDTVAIALIRHGPVNLDKEDHYGSTPFSIAVRHSRTQIVNMLLATGQVSLHSQDRFGRTPWYWARRCGTTEIQGVLLDYVEKRGIVVSKNSGEVIEESFIPHDGTSRWCDVCTLGIPEDVAFYHCEVCSGGDFDICPGCYKIGARCLGDDHELAQENIIKE
ncbi:hypothetical protein FOTG_18201 [Fusarium oxysporum f. sp. vasinfectum 25433]|uniref:NACHT domain-containing protein n=1 Tax=Fusarium oxysporum f. sp. vasinfectum 25433 TaxID=1089449 RepID=X0KIM9_FUSOX|nr:hypothetical protein FOTG_18201 [Fusarium oxysporum f. sp. vasinfectum 25433]